MRRLETPLRHSRSIHLAEKCKDESVLLAAGRWMCRFCDPRVKFQHGEERSRLTVRPHLARLSMCSCGKERTASICCRDLPCLQSGISVKWSVQHQSGGCRLPEPRQAHVSDGAKSATGRPFLRNRRVSQRSC